MESEPRDGRCFSLCVTDFQINKLGKKHSQVLEKKKIQDHPLSFVVNSVCQFRSFFCYIITKRNIYLGSRKLVKNKLEYFSGCHLLTLKGLSVLLHPKGGSPESVHVS